MVDQLDDGRFDACDGGGLMALYQLEALGTQDFADFGKLAGGGRAVQFHFAEVEAANG